MNLEVLVALRHSIFRAPDARFNIHYFVYLNDSAPPPVIPEDFVAIAQKAIRRKACPKPPL